MEALRGRNGFDGTARSGKTAAQELSEHLEASGVAGNLGGSRAYNARSSIELLRNPATRIARARIPSLVPSRRGNRKHRNAKPWNPGRQYRERLPRSGFTASPARV